ncbi:outer membrane beta-barrel protein [Pseudoalteromonas sp. Z9A5]|uniref:outer membrane beta-barrel protein n=1 Tax=Pseudoalteromonas sp. Z9A5 TaxID=2686355 RepID=UPI00140B05C0|nr:outer membrane beta-barrel protein [Pseudoalteromonas sp. Z9A5]
MRMHTNNVTPLLFALCLGTSLPTLADFKAGSLITKDGAEITPTLQTGLSTNNNFFSTPENEESRLIWTVAPNVIAEIKDGPDSYKVNLGTSSSLHNKDTADNFTQVNIGAGVHKEFTSQHRLDFDGTADWLYEPRGSGLTEGLGNTINELVKYQQQDITGRYEYGALSSKAQIALTAGFFSKKYQNFREVSQFRDYDKSLVGITGYYNTQSSTRTFLEVKQENYRYGVLQANGISRDSDDVKVLIGMQWDATAVTSGSFKIGYQNKDFSSDQRQSFSGISWDAAVTWQPLSYSSVQLTTSRAAKDPLVQGDYIRESAYGVRWSHGWSDDLSSLASLNYIDEEYTGDIGRKDKTKNARLGLNYTVNSFGMVSTYVDIMDKNSTQDRLEFDRVVVGINFTFALKAN